MKKEKSLGTNLKPLMALLAGKDGGIRQNARESLVALGKPAVSSLSKALKNSVLTQVRWESAKALDAIGSPRSIQPLVLALADKDRDVAWLAGEALSKFGKDAWPELLRALIKGGADSALFRQGAHHVLCNQKVAGFDDLLPALLKDLESNAVREETMVIANDIYRRLKQRPSS
jgi:HEAT repeat protein